ncbi:MAG: TetR/AcrR family transcriptional regulator [Clostridiales bacterium]|nr:TetR/AcrR family transcriptional regulator [Clostridiales bacterium]
MNNTNGLIAEQSKKTIAKAMLKVMKIYDYKEITVTQITQEAQVSRKTFYRHFRDKDEVLKHLFDSLYQECISSITNRGIHHYWDVVQCFFDFWEKHSETLKLMNQSNLLPQLFEESYGRSFEVFRSVKSEDIAEHYKAQLPYLLAYSIGGMNSMLIKWIENGMSIPSSTLISCLKEGFSSELL